MKYTMIIIVAIILISCGRPEANLVVEVLNVERSIVPVVIRQYTIDGCEYVGNLSGLKVNFLAHKGNCKGCRISHEKDR